MGIAGRLSIGVVGTGRMARTMIPTIVAHGHVKVSAVASRSADRARAFAHDFGIEKAVSEPELLADSTIDAVYVANDNALHAATTIAALRAGKAVLCEKPLAVSFDEARKVIDIALETGTLLMEAISTPYLPAVRSAIDMARGGQLGRVQVFSADFGYPVTPASNPKLFVAGGGVLLDRAVYTVALALDLLGPVERVVASVEYGHAGIDVAALLQLGHISGGRSQLAVSLNSLLSNRASIGCERGAIVIGAPLLKAEVFHVDSATPPEASSVEPSRVRTKLSGWSLLRRAVAVKQLLSGTYKSYGATHYYPEFVHFVDLIRNGAKQSSILPLSSSLEIQRVLAAAHA